MSEFFRNRLDAAHAMIDERDFERAVEIIKNLSMRIHDAVILNEIKSHDDNIDQTFIKNINAINSKVYTGDPVDIASQRNQDIFMQRQWKAQEYVRFYDLLSREHEL
jgi:hypothetical protein